MKDIKVYIDGIIQMNQNTFIPLLNNNQIVALNEIKDKTGTGDSALYTSVQKLIDEEATVIHVNINKDNILVNIKSYFDSLLNTTTKANAGATSLFTKSSLESLDKQCNILQTIISGNIVSPGPYGNNINTAKYFIGLIHDSLSSLLNYQINRQKNDILQAKIDIIPYNKALAQQGIHNSQLSLDNKRYENDRALYNYQNSSRPYKPYNFAPFFIIFWNWYRISTVGGPPMQSQPGVGSGGSISVPTKDPEPDVGLTLSDLNSALNSEGKAQNLNLGSLANNGLTLSSQGNVLQSINTNYKLTGSSFDINDILNNSSIIFGSI